MWNNCLAALKPTCVDKKEGNAAEIKYQENFIYQIVTDIDAIVRVVRFPGWQKTISGEREVQKSLRKALLKYKLHKDQILFDRAYAYIKEYY